MVKPDQNSTSDAEQILPEEAFDRFAEVCKKPGQPVPGLVAAIRKATRKFTNA